VLSQTAPITTNIEVSSIRNDDRVLGMGILS